MTPLTPDEELLLDAAGETSRALLDRMAAWVEYGRPPGGAPVYRLREHVQTALEAAIHTVHAYRTTPAPVPLPIAPLVHAVNEGRRALGMAPIEMETTR